MRKPKTRINFLPASMRKAAVRPSTVVFSLLGGSLLIPLLGFGLAQWQSSIALTQVTQSQRLAETETKIQAQIAARDGGDAAVLRSVQKALAERQYWSEIFKELGNIGPQKIWLTTFTAKIEDKAKKVVISGNSATQAEIAEFYSRLEKSFYFRDLHIKFTESTKDIEPQIYRFEFEGTLFEPAREVADGKI
jgi:Tfp pilus assembly protein PilN